MSNTSIANRGLRSALLTLAIAAGLPAVGVASGSGDIQPIQSKLYPRGSTSLMLDIERAGNGFVAVGERGHILVSEDGNAWTQVVAPVNSLLTAASFADSKNGWAVGHDAAILHSGDGGKSWTLQHFEPNGVGPLLDVQFDSPEHGFAVGAFGTFLETADAGETWTAVEAPVVADAGAHLYSIQHFDNGRWLIVGELGFIATSRDGRQWDAVDSPYHGSFYDAVQFGETGAVLVGMRGNAFLTPDLATGEWTSCQTGTVLSLTSVTRASQDEFLVTTLNRQLLRITSSGDVSRLQAPESDIQASNTGSFNDALVVGDELLVASDHGVLHAALAATQVSMAPAD